MLVPMDAKLSYKRIITYIHPQKQETHRTELATGGYLLDYKCPNYTPTEGLATAKCMFNSAISTEDDFISGINVIFFKPWNTVAQPEITMNAHRLHSGRNYTRIWVKKTIIEGLVIH